MTFKPLTIEPIAFSLTDGTNIPPPPDSPPARPPTPSGGPLSSHPTTPQNEGLKEDASMGPPPAKKQAISPSQSGTSDEKRPSSVRKLLSLRSLRDKNRDSHYGTLGSPNGKLSTDSHSPSHFSRPGSPYTTMSNDTNGSNASRARKRGSVWFGSKRKSGFFNGRIDENFANGGAVQPPERRGPPPPTLPEFQEFTSLNGALNGGSLGADDLFKDIK